MSDPDQSRIGLLDGLQMTFEAEEKEYQREQKIKEEAIAAIQKVNDLGDLSSLRRVCDSRTKEIVRKEVGKSKLFNNDQLYLLDYVWDLRGDLSWASEPGKPPYNPETGEPFCEMEMDRYLGWKVESNVGNGTIAKMADGGYGIRLRLPCNRCHKSRKTVYARPGCHVGAFCYIYDRYGKFLADLRNQEFVCWRCT